MKITVMTDLHSVDALRKQFAQSRGKRRSVRQKRVDQLAIVLRQVRSAMRQIIEGAAGTLQDALRPALDVVGRDRFRSELDDVGTACKRELQLGDTPPDLVHAPQIGGLLIAVPGGLGGEEALFLDETVQVSACHRPYVALILHEAVDDGDGAANSVLLELDASEQGRGVRERNRFGEKTTDLDFRIEAPLEAAKELDDVVRSNQDRRVGLLGVHGVHVLDRDRAVLRKSRRRRELQSTLVAF